jgi:hypothetical protein
MLTTTHKINNMPIFVTKQIDVNNIIEAIKVITGLTPVEEISNDRYCLKLGTKNPLEIGYDKNRKLIPEDKMKYSALIKMLEIISNMMQSESEFIDWLDENSKDK